MSDTLRGVGLALVGEPRLLLRDAVEGAPLELFPTITHDADFALASVWVEAEA